MAAAAAGPGEIPPGTPIVAITVVRDDIFDTSEPGTSAWPYRWADHLHVLTRERFIRSLLLFKVGDPLDPALLAETERLLRGTGFLSPVTITARPAAGGAEVVVRTHDQWTTEVGLSFGAFGNRRHAGGSLTEENFLGWGKELDVEYDSTSERTTTTFEYKDSLLLGSRWQLQLLHKNASDGKSDGFHLEYPFFALATPRAAAVDWQSVTLTEYLYADGNKAVSGAARTASFLLWGGLRLPGDAITTNRLTLGVFYDEAEFSQWQLVRRAAVPDAGGPRHARRPGRLGPPGGPLGGGQRLPGVGAPGGRGARPQLDRDRRLLVAGVRGRPHPHQARRPAEPGVAAGEAVLVAQPRGLGQGRERGSRQRRDPRGFRHGAHRPRRVARPRRARPRAQPGRRFASSRSGPIPACAAGTRTPSTAHRGWSRTWSGGTCSPARCCTSASSAPRCSRMPARRGTRASARPPTGCARTPASACSSSPPGPRCCA